MNNSCDTFSRINSFPQQYNNNGNNFNPNSINNINNYTNNGTCNNMMGHMNNNMSYNLNNDKMVYNNMNRNCDMIDVMNFSSNMNMMNNIENIGGTQIYNVTSNNKGKCINNYNNHNNNKNNDSDNFDRNNLVNNDTNMNPYKRLNKILSITKKCLEDPNNANHELYKQYCKNFSNPFFQNKEITLNYYVQSKNNLTQLKISQKEYEDEPIDHVDEINDEEKRTTIKIKGIQLAYKKGDTIISTLQNFKMGTHEGHNLYDIVYQPVLDKDNQNKFFVVNFRKSEFIKDFDEAMRKYLSKNELNNNYKLYWYPLQGDKFRKYLEDKKEKKKPYEGFIKYL
jgi:hypothetical protein